MYSNENGFRSLVGQKHLVRVCATALSQHEFVAAAPYITLGPTTRQTEKVSKTIECFAGM